MVLVRIFHSSNVHFLGVIDALHGEVGEYIFLDWMLKQLIQSIEVVYVRNIQISVAVWHKKLHSKNVAKWRNFY